MENIIPEKARLLGLLKQGGFNVPEFLYVPAEDFETENFDDLELFLREHVSCFKLIARSCHPHEDCYKGGTFDSLETHADVMGIKYARQAIINRANKSRRLSILRQQQFNNSPVIDMEEMGVMVMPFIEGESVMAKMIGQQWEFGYSGSKNNTIQTEPCITLTPHDLKLLQVSEEIQQHLGFRCEIEYIISELGELFVVQARDISKVEALQRSDDEQAVHLDGLRRIRKRRNYRERPVYVMNTKSFYLDIIARCEEIVLDGVDHEEGMDNVLQTIADYEAELEAFALRHQRFGVIGLTIDVPKDLFQVANHYLDETPDLQKRLSLALRNNMYVIDQFIAESDTLIAKDRYRRNLCTHDAYGVDTVRNPLWNVYWSIERHEEVTRQFMELGIRTGDIVAIHIDFGEKPRLIRL